MNAIVFPIQPGASGPTVADLQAALAILLERALLLSRDDGARMELSHALRREQESQRYSDVTRRLVETFQGERQLRADGAVDEATASALNGQLRELGLLDPAPPSPPEERARIVAGRVTRGDGSPFAGRVSVLHVGVDSELRLGADDTDADGRYTVKYGSLPDGGAISLRVDALDPGGQVIQRSEIVRDPPRQLTVDLAVPLTRLPTAPRRIEGRLVFDHGIPAEQLALKLYRIGFGGPEAAERIAEGKSREHGLYALAYDGSENSAPLEIRALGADGKEVALTAPIRNAAALEVMNLVVPASLQVLEPEYKRLTGSITPHVGELVRLGQAREDAQQQDLTLLHEATGWDARLIAMASRAVKLSAPEATGLSADALYGLMRAGLPSDPLQLARVSADAFDQAMAKSRSAGIVSLDDAQAAQLKQSFEQFSLKTRLSVPAPGSRATYGELLAQTQLPPEKQQAFAKLYLDHHGDPEQLWQKAADAGLADAVPVLKKQGKLAFLTTNQPALTARLQQELGDHDPAHLVRMGLHKKEAWLDRITDVPAAYADAEDPKGSYAEDMARKVRISYSTEVAWNMVETGELQIEGGNDALSRFLGQAIAHGFKLGETGIDAFLKAHPQALDGIADADRVKTVQMAKALQRVYQITPGNDALKALMNAGLLSAQDVLAYPLDVFLARFGGLFPSVEQARLVYRKAEQVSSLGYSVFTLAKELDGAPTLHALSGSAAERSTVKQGLLDRFPTMERLFGSLDFCECEHCRSVLSPAAYLVDLLQFLDRKPKIWEGTLKDWSTRYGGAPYPFKTAEAAQRYLDRWRTEHPGAPDPAPGRTPYQILIERRPDIPHIELSCENTNTALPQIDLVNEILEYHVAHGALAAEAARDTGSLSSAELLAQPQYVIDEAYAALAGARYPIGLPYDTWSDAARAYSAALEVPWAQMLDVLRPGDALFDPAKRYDRAAVFLESLGLSPEEAGLFGDPDPLSHWFTLYGFDSAAAALTEDVDADTGQRIGLISAKTLSRRLGVTYRQLAEVLRTGFVNPNLDAMVALRNLGLQPEDVRTYQADRPLLAQPEGGMTRDQLQRRGEAAAFERRLDALTARHSGAGFDSRAWLQSAIDDGRFDAMLVLADTAVAGNFDETRLQRSNGQPAQPIDFLRINLFVRLWRKLGWRMDELDRALTAFMPKEAPFEPEHLAKAPLASALIHMAHLNTLSQRVQAGRDSRLKLLTLWTPLFTTGDAPLYRQLFLAVPASARDRAFDHPLGHYLSAPDVPLREHLPPLQAALGLRLDDMERVLKSSGSSIATANLTMDTVSLLYRHVTLAKALGLDIAEVLALKDLSGLDPFAPLHPKPLTTIEDDKPFTQTLAFVDVVGRLKEAGVDVGELDWLLRRRPAPGDTVEADGNVTLAFSRTLVDGLLPIDREHALPADPLDWSDETLRQKLGLALPADVVDTLSAMLVGTAEFTVTLPAPAPLDTASFAGEPALVRLAHNPVTQLQALTWRGVLFDDEKARLKARFPTPLFGELLDAVQARQRDLFANHLLRTELNETLSHGFLEAADFDTLFKPPLPVDPSSPPDQQAAALAANEKAGRAKRARLAAAFLPWLRKRLQRRFLVDMLAASTGQESSRVEALVTDKSLLALDGEPLLDAFMAAAAGGVGATFYDRLEPDADPSGRAVLPDADVASGVLPAGTKRMRIAGTLQVAAPGPYRFFVTAPGPAVAARLRIEAIESPVMDGDLGAAGISGFTELKAGVPYRYSLELRGDDLAGARLQVQGESMPRGPLSRLRLMADSTLERVDSARALLVTALRLIALLALNERELWHLAAHADRFDGNLLLGLPDAGIDNARKSFRRVLRLADYKILKTSLAGGRDLVDVFEASTLEEGSARLARLSRREPAQVLATAQALIGTALLVNEQPLERLWRVLQWVQAFGVTVTEMRQWTELAGRATDAAGHKLRAQRAREMQAALQARFEPSTWRRVVQPINDHLRRNRRDALVAFVLHRLGLERMEQLFAHFWLDPGVEPVVQSSRIRSAIAAVQIFINRCLINLEPLVPASAIDARQWGWMKRYPVWAGNRQLFLFPENVLEPEFRDDKSHLFSELEGKLLQGDVSADLVEDAFYNYLKKLDELARLEIVAMYCEEQPLDPVSNRLHVIGRTYAAPHRYFYRRQSHGAWTPWEPVPIDIDGDHLVPVVWRDRLNLFWVTFLEQADPEAAPSDDSGIAAAVREEVSYGGKLPYASSKSSKQQKKNTPVAEMSLGQLAGDLRNAANRRFVQVQLHWSEYFQGAWSTRETGGPSVSQSVPVPTDFDSRKVLIHASKEFDAGEERAVKIHLAGQIDRAFRIVSRNARPERANRDQSPLMPYGAPTVQANRHGGRGALKVTYTQRIVTEDGKPPALQTASSDILGGGSDFTVLPCANALSVGDAEIASLVAPFFYQDSLSNTFFVEPKLREKTIEEWQEWVTRTPVPEAEWNAPAWWGQLELAPMVPKVKIPVPVDPGAMIWRDEIDPRAKFGVAPKRDWLVNPNTALRFDDDLIGPAGRAGLGVAKSNAASAVSVTPGGALGPGQTVLSTDAMAFKASGLGQVRSSSLNVVGAAGVNATLLKSIQSLGKLKE